MVRDRLIELQKNCNYTTLAATKNEKNDSISIETDSNSTQHKINQILKEYSNVREEINEIKDNTQTMRNLVYPSLSRSFRKSSKDLLDAVENHRQKNMTLCLKIFKQMKELESELPDEDDFTILSRIKRTNFYCTREDFIDAWRRHEEFLVQYEEKIKRDLMRQAKLIDENITEEETETLIANNTTSLFVGNILEDTQMARQKLRDLLIRHSELAKVEKSLIEVRDMFIRISTLVMEQDSMIQIIEYHAQRATVNVDKGAEQLEKARDLKIKKFKRKTWILMWVIGILAVLVIIALIL